MLVGSLTVNGTARSGSNATGGVNGSPGAPDGQVAHGGTYDDRDSLGGGGGSAGDVTGSYLGGRTL